uniref:Centromere protein Cenp-F leucine-rich repeat-containing domain-containing protein n=1 Tax=Callorhinchus milii TaxID=7868 RepID=A0A4W3IML3_CALMI
MDLEELEGSLESHGLQTEKMQADLNNIQNKCQCSEEQRALLQKDLSAVQAEMEAMCLKFSASVNREESLVDQIAVQEQAIEKLRSDLEKRKEQEFVLVRSLENLQHQCNESQTKYKLKAEEECLKVAEILELKDKLFLCQSELSNSITRNSDLESKLDSVQQESKVQMQTALNNMETTIQQGEEQRELLQKNLSEVHSELEGMHLKFSENKNHKESLMKQVALQSLTIEDLKSELKESKEQEVVLLSSLENTQSQFTESQIKAEEEHQLREKEILELNQLKERNATLVTEIEATQSKLDMIKLEKLELVKLLESSMLQKGEVEAKLNSTRAELDSLKQQYSSEIEEWQLKLSNLTTEMECKLAVEKQQTQLLLKGLESARIQLHSLNLCSQSLCDSDLDADDTPQKVSNAIMQNNNLKVELEESHWEQKCTIDQIQFDSHESLCDQVEHSPTQVGDVSQTQFEQESGKMVNEMLSEIESFRSSLDTQQKQLVSRTTACNELEKKVMLLEEEKHCLCNELNSSVVENQNLSEKIKDLEDELSNNTLQQQVDKVKLSDVTKMLESLEMAKESWNEKVLELENALKRAKSDKANLEKHILEMEVDLDKMQIRKDTLEKEVESNQKITTDQEEILTDLKTKNTRISWELNTLAEVNDELEKTNQSLKVKVQELEADKIYSTNTNRVLEADTKKLTEQLQSATEQMEKISREKKDLMHQLQNLEENTMSDTTRNKQQLKQLTEGNATLVTEIEAVQSKLDMIKLEKLELVKLLESSMLEKGEIATRLNSTQAEVAEMRHAIEKLKVRIEADQKKSQFVAEKLKASDRKADSLQDRIETLERELQVAEENLEDMVLQAETAKEQSEVLEEENKTITEKLATLSMELNTISSEKEDLKKQLQQNQEKLEELEIHFSETDEIERNKMAKTYENSVGELQSKISHLNKQIDVCNGELEKLRVKEEDWLDHTSCLEREKAQLIQQLQEAERLNEELRSVDMTLNKDLKVVQQHLGEHIQEKGRLQQQVIDLEQWKQEVSKEMSNLQDEKANFDEKKNNLQVALTEAQQSKQDLAAKNEIIQVTLETLENSEKRLKNELEIARSQSSVDELQSTMAKLKKDKASAQNKLFLWMRNCKQLEQEKESLKKYTEQQDELITKLQKSSDSLVDDLRTELKELRESLEEKTNEADENIEKYWNLIKNSHTLEEENEMLKNRVEMLGSHLQQSSSQSLSNNGLSKRAESKKETDEQKPGTWSKRTRSGNTPGASKSAAHSDHVHQPEALPGVIKKGKLMIILAFDIVTFMSGGQLKALYGILH